VAAQYVATDSLRYLIQSGVDVMRTNEAGQTALHVVNTADPAARWLRSIYVSREPGVDALTETNQFDPARQWRSFAAAKHFLAVKRHICPGVQREAFLWAMDETDSAGHAPAWAGLLEPARRRYWSVSVAMLVAPEELKCSVRPAGALPVLRCSRCTGESVLADLPLDVRWRLLRCMGAVREMCTHQGKGTVAASGGSAV
jgi:hypothetical protein